MNLKNLILLIPLFLLIEKAHAISWVNPCIEKPSSTCTKYTVNGTTVTVIETRIEQQEFSGIPDTIGVAYPEFCAAQAVKASLDSSHSHIWCEKKVPPARGFPWESSVDVELVAIQFDPKTNSFSIQGSSAETRGDIWMSILLWLALLLPLIKPAIQQGRHPNIKWIIPNIVVIVSSLIEISLITNTHIQIAFMGLSLIFITMVLSYSNVSWKFIGKALIIDIVPYLLLAFCSYKIGENAFSFLDEWVVDYVMVTIFTTLIILIQKKEQAV